MGEDIAITTANVANIEELREWGTHFSLERATKELMLDFYDVVDVPRVVVEASHQMPETFLQLLRSSRPSNDLVIPDISVLDSDAATILRDIIFQGSNENFVYYRFMFLGVSSRNDLTPTQSELLAMCTPIDLGVFVQRNKLINSANELISETKKHRKPAK